MRKFMLIVFAAVLFLSGCTADKTDKSKSAEKTQSIEVRDNSSYKNVLYNFYKAYEKGDAEYMMATFSPQYKNYVIKTYGYGDEETMKQNLQDIISSQYTQYETAAGGDFEIVYEIESEKTLAPDAASALENEMKGKYGESFKISKAVSVNVKASVIGQSEGRGIGENEITFALLDDGNWYILK